MSDDSAGSIGPDGSLSGDTSSRTSLSLLARARDQDDVAWSRIVRLYGPLVAHWCRRCGFSFEDAGDLTQEVFASVARKLGEFRRTNENGSFRGWLRTITSNKIRDHVRRNAGAPNAAGGSAAQLRLAQLVDIDQELWNDDDPSDGAAESDVYQRALDLVRGEFETKTWQAFWQMTVDGRSAGETATSLEMTPGAVRQAKYKVMRRLRLELEDLMEWPGAT